MRLAHKIPMDVRLILVCLLFLPPALAKECTYNATFIKKEKELFNKTNYETVCLGQGTDYKGELTKCNGYFINPKCVCAYELYALDIRDICEKTAPRENGSLDNTDVQFCIKYSYTHAGPCQNGGVLVNESRQLARHAKCRCKEGFSGDYCDTVSRPIVCTESKPGSMKVIRNCVNEFIAYPGDSSCFLTISNGYFICDTQKNVTDGAMDCSIPAFGRQREDNAPSGKGPLSGSLVLLVFLVVLLRARRLAYGDVF